MARYGSRYTLDGGQLGSDHPVGLIAMNAVGGLAATQPRARQFSEALWNVTTPSGRYRYYDGMLYVPALLHCSREFSIRPSPQAP